jgi:hypothetical protein
MNLYILLGKGEIITMLQIIPNRGGSCMKWFAYLRACMHIPLRNRFNWFIFSQTKKFVHAICTYALLFSSFATLAVTISQFTINFTKSSKIQTFFRLDFIGWFLYLVKMSNEYKYHNIHTVYMWSKCRESYSTFRKQRVQW